MTERFGYDPLTTAEAFEPPRRRTVNRRRSQLVAPGSARFAHIRPLDGLRGVAVLAVVVYHFSPSIAPGGFLGVDVFFVLSGFLITSLLVSEYDVATSISLRSFWIRRARRLLPALLLVLAVMGVYALLVHDRVEGQKLGVDGLAALGYFANWHFIASSQSYIQRFVNRVSPLRHTWSLSIEEQFYFIWPMVVAGIGVLVARAVGARRRARSFRRVVVLTSIVLASISMIAMALLFRESDPSRVYYGTDTHVHGLAIGATLGALTAGAPAVRGRAWRLALVIMGSAAGCALVAAFVWLTISTSWLYRGGYLLVVLAVALVILGAAQPGPNPLSRFLSSRGLVILGLISYGVYLWHWPIGLWLTEDQTALAGVPLFALRMVATLVVAIASFVILEQPIRRGRLPSFGRLRPAGAIGLLVSVVVLVLAIPAITFPSVAQQPATAAPSSVARAVTSAYASAARCDDPHSVTRRLTVHGRPLRVQTIGNSFIAEPMTCLDTIIRAAGGTTSLVFSPGYSACQPSVEAEIRRQASNPRERPDVAIYLAVPAPPAGTAEASQLACEQPQNLTRAFHRLIAIWKRAGTFVYFATDPPPAGASSDALDNETIATYRRLAAESPHHVSVLDSGVFLRDRTGVYQWQMPCLPLGEIGCGPTGTVGVRWAGDGGRHFCADPSWDGSHCQTAFAGGERRLAAALAQQIFERFGT